MNRYLLIILMVIELFSLSHAAVLNSVSLKSSGTSVSVTCSFPGAYQYHVFTLGNPERVVLDLSDTDVAKRVVQDLKGKRAGFITSVRSGHPNPNTLRIVFDVNQKARITALPAGGRGYGQLNLVIAPAQSAGVVKPIVPAIVVHRPPAVVRQSAYNKRHVIMVVIDPGHGGKDPGARGPHGSLEKNVVLGLSEKLKMLIDREPGMRAVLTRKGDYYLGLRERLNIARKNNADIFIAIHSDAFVNSHSNGASVFALSQRGATSEAARWLAEKENYSELGGVNLKGLDDRSGLIRTVLIDLSQTATITSSLHLGAEVLHGLGAMTRLHNHRVEQARFVVLKSPDIPSILIETGFISNPNEERNLTNPQYQMRLARAIFGGLKRYFWEYPPHANPSSGF